MNAIKELITAKKSFEHTLSAEENDFFVVNTSMRDIVITKSKSNSGTEEEYDSMRKIIRTYCSNKNVIVVVLVEISPSSGITLDISARFSEIISERIQDIPIPPSLTGGFALLDDKSLLCKAINVTGVQTIKEVFTTAVQALYDLLTSYTFTSDIERTQNYISSKTKDSITNVSAKVTELDNEISKLFTEVASKASLLNSYKKQKELLEKALEDKENYVSEIYKSISMFPEVKTISSSDNSLIIYTNPIKAYNRRDDLVHVIGELIIKVNNSGVYIFNKWGDIRGKGFPHSYKAGLSHVCLGNISADVPYLLGVANYEELIAYLIGFVSTANMEDTFGKDLVSFPLDPCEPRNAKAKQVFSSEANKYTRWAETTSGYWSEMTTVSLKERLGYKEDAEEFCNPLENWR